ncbi:MAG: ABC transporter ATP-binding protein/permease [Butyrivibrio sp.]|nr:ABC transporter ATP-binding protein/permease [Butyrivibrio sp.]
MRKQQTDSTDKISARGIVFKTLKYFTPLAWRTHKGFFLCAFLEILFRAAQPFVAIITTPLIINELLGARDIGRLAVYAAVTVIAGTLLTLGNSVLGVQTEKYAERFDNILSEEISRRAMELDFQLTEDKNALDQIEKAKEGISWYSGGVVGILHPFFYLLSALITIAGAVTIIFIHAPLLFAVTGVILAVQFFIRIKQNKLETESYIGLSKLNRIFGYLGFQITDIPFGKDIRLYDASDMMADKWNSYTLKNLKVWKNQSNRDLPLNILHLVSDVAKDFGYYIYLGILAIAGKISIGVFSQMLTTGATFHSQMQTVTESLSDISKRSLYAYEFIKFMEYPAAIEKGERHVENKPHTIEFRSVSFTYPNTDVRVLDGISLTITPGEHLSVVGLNGAGKTTFIKLMCRLYDPTGGEILLDGVNIKEYDYNEYMSIFSPVFQDFKLFAFSVAENIVLDDECGRDELDRLTARVGLSDKLGSLANGADTLLFKAFDENGVEPSGGEQQKIAIARALHKKAPVVILDEPTAALDPVAEYEIYRQFESLVGGKTAIYISHRLSSCRFCDRIAVFSEGKIKEYGTHDELVGNPNGIYAEMFAAQAQYYN